MTTMTKSPTRFTGTTHIAHTALRGTGCALMGGTRHAGVFNPVLRGAVVCALVAGTFLVRRASRLDVGP